MAAGSPPYSYQWLSQVPGASEYNDVANAVASSFNFTTSTATSTGNWDFILQVTDSSGTVVDSNPVAVTVYPLLTAPSVTPSPVAVDQGQSSTLASSSVTSGSGSDSYLWYCKAPSGAYAIVSGEFSSSYTFVASTASASGAYSFILQVTDSTGAAVNSTAVTVNINSTPSVTISPSSQEIDTGQSVTLTATPAGGSGTYTYQWDVNGTAQNPTTSTITFAPSSAGISLVTVTVTGSLGALVTSNSAVVIVGTSPTVAIMPANSVSLTTGQTQMFAAATSGGLGSLSYQWYIDGSPVGGNSASYTYTAAGTAHSITCKVTDNAGAIVTSAATTITVTSSQPSPTVSPSGTPSATPKQSPNQNGSSNSALPEILIIIVVALVAVGAVVGLTLNKHRIK